MVQYPHAVSATHRPSSPRIIEKIRILGIDPGSRLTGYGIVDLRGNELHHVTHGTLKLASTSGKATIPLEKRLLDLFNGLQEIIEEYQPRIMAIEKVFFAKNAVSALKLGQARGAAMVCGARQGLEIVEYSPNEVKSAIVGHGHADKDQVAAMLERMLGKQDFATSDASDGLALAVCHARIAGSHSALAEATKRALTGSSKKKRMSLAESLGLSPEVVGTRKRIAVSKE